MKSVDRVTVGLDNPYSLRCSNCFLIVSPLFLLCRLKRGLISRAFFCQKFPSLFFLDFFLCLPCWVRPACAGDASTETLNNIAVINGAYGELILSNRMGLTKELQKSASDQLSIYEIDQPRGSRDTYNRAIMMLDGVNSEILLAVRQLWQQEILSGIEAAEADRTRALV